MNLTEREKLLLSIALGSAASNCDDINDACDAEGQRWTETGKIEVRGKMVDAFKDDEFLALAEKLA